MRDERAVVDLPAASILRYRIGIRSRAFQAARRVMTLAEFPGRAAVSGEQDEPTFAAWCQDIRDTQGTPIFRQLVADLAAEINEGKFDGEGEGRRGEGSEPAGFEARRERDQDQQQQGR